MFMCVCTLLPTICMFRKVSHPHLTPPRLASPLPCLLAMFPPYIFQSAAVSTAMTSLVKTLGLFGSEKIVVNRERARGKRSSYGVIPYLLGKIISESPITACFPIMFSAILYPLCGLDAKPKKFVQMMAVFTLESFVASAMGLAIGSLAPSPEAAMAIGPPFMVLFIIFGGGCTGTSNVILSICPREPGCNILIDERQSLRQQVYL